MLDEVPPPGERRRLQALAALSASIGGFTAAGLLLTGLSFGAPVIGVAVTLALVGVTAGRSGLPGAFGVLVAYAFAFGLFIWSALFLAVLALWGGWQ